MLRFRNYLPLVVVLVGTVLLGAPAQSHAGFQMTLSDSDGNSRVINDNNIPAGTGMDLDPTTGNIIFSGALGSFNIQISVGTSNSAANVQPAQLTINNTSISSTGYASSTTKTVTITLEDTGFTAPSTGLQAGMESQLSTTQLPVGSAVSFQSFLNGVGGTVLNANTVGGSRVNEAVIIPSSPYTLKNVTTYSIQGQGAGSSLTVQTTGITAVAVPAPAGLVLLASGIPALGLVWLRRKMRAPTA
jgi:hypothetical protein